MAHLYSVSLCGIFASYGFWQTQLVHKNGTRCGWEAKKQTAVHKTTPPRFTAQGACNSNLKLGFISVSCTKLAD